MQYNYNNTLYSVSSLTHYNTSTSKADTFWNLNTRIKLPATKSIIAVPMVSFTRGYTVSLLPQYLILVVLCHSFYFPTIPLHTLIHHGKTFYPILISVHNTIPPRNIHQSCNNVYHNPICTLNKYT